MLRDKICILFLFQFHACVSFAQPATVDRHSISAGLASVIEERKEVPITHRADLVVVGASYGGLGGCMAAAAAARLGANAILLEEGGTIGLHIPISLGVVLGIDGWKPNVGEGLFRELTKEIAETGQYYYSPLTFEQILEEQDRILIRYHDTVKNAMLSFLQKSGVKMLFHTKFVDAVVVDGEIEAVIVESPSGRHAIQGETFIDSTGTADVAFAAGAPTFREEPFIGLQMFVSGVDEPRYRGWAEAESEPLDDSYRVWLESQIGPIEEWAYPWDQWWNEYLGDRMSAAVVRRAREANENGDLTMVWRRGRNGVLAIPEGIKSDPNVARPRTYVTGIDPMDVEDISWVEVTSRLALNQFQHFLKDYIPGFENCVIERIADTYALRGGRYLAIEDPPTEEDRGKGKTNPDCVFVIQRGRDAAPYQFPYRALVPEGVEGLLVVGKSTAGGRHFRTAHDVLFQGQAAGTAAYLATRDGVSVREVDIEELQDLLRENGVDIPE